VASQWEQFGEVEKCDRFQRAFRHAETAAGANSPPEWHLRLNLTEPILDFGFWILD
jgi:hypothetical protein